MTAQENNREYKLTLSGQITKLIAHNEQISRASVIKRQSGGGSKGSSLNVKRRELLKRMREYQVSKSND